MLAERVPAVLVLIALLAGAVPAIAQDSAASWGIGPLMRDLSGVKRSEARFTERKYLQVLKSPLVTSGTLSYEAPGHLEKRTLKPRPESLLVDGDRVFIESAARNEHRELRLQDYPVLQAFVESIRGTLGGDLAALERFYKVELEGDPERWRLVLTPRERQMKQVISLILIGGSRARIDTVEVQEARGDRSVMKVYEDAR
jgi:outer membrane lipoprotein-sorting protein